MKNTGKDFPPASLRTLQVLDLFMKDPAPKTLKEISEQLDIPFTSLYRIVLCMQEYRYLVEDSSKRNHFRLGYKLAQMSNIVFTQKNLIQLARPYMNQVAAELNQACQLCILTEDGVCTIEQRLPSSAITYITNLNETIGINTSASGKVLASLLPEAEQQFFLERATARFIKRTEHTIVDPAKFKAHLIETAQRKYGTDIEEYATGIGCIAVPIFTEDNNAVAAIGTTGPIEYYQNEESFQKILSYLRDVAWEISNKII